VPMLKNYMEHLERKLNFKLMASIFDLMAYLIITACLV
jgi:hypothetical protein